MIDVILPVHNRPHYVERAINSVLAQSEQGFKLYVIDDGSTDETSTILQKFNNNPKVQILSQPNLGVSAARNLGIRSSRAAWIAFLDSDDEWLPEKLAVQKAFIEQNPDYNFVHTNEIWIRNGVRVNPKKKFDKSSDEIFRRSLETCLISPSTVMMKRELCLKHGCFDESFIICEDYDLWLSVLAEEEVGFIPQFLIKKHGGHGDQLSTRYSSMDFWRVKALIKLTNKPLLTSEQKALVHEQLEHKLNVLKANYLKHQNTQGLCDLSELLLQRKI